MRQIKEISPLEGNVSIEQLMLLAGEFNEVAILNSNNYQDPYGKYDLLAAFGAHRKLSADTNSFEALTDFMRENPAWLFGHFSYELKNQLEDLHSDYPPQFDFPLLHFFEPIHLYCKKRGEEKGKWYSHDENSLKDLLEEADRSKLPSASLSFPPFQPAMSRGDYLEKIEYLKEQIRYGNIYEVNYCQNFFSKAEIDPEGAYLRLNQSSPMPFSSYYRLNDDYMFGASPERFICKRNRQLICQPIKGTARRSDDPEQDRQIAASLKNDLKEQTENVMIVDLMRNDLSRSAARGSVNVEELFGVYAFPQVHQLISTITAELRQDVQPLEAILRAFPMGSMTGAPKISAMKLIEETEVRRRELYSGSIGYFDPSGDFDFNVVIRSLLYSNAKKYLSLTVGGAITDLATAEAEYDECLLKAKAIFESDPAP